jgi:general secretion pathway protein H
MTLRHDRARRARAAGFTLLETLIVLAILSLAVALAVPYLGRQTPRAALGAAAQEVRAALTGARSAAIAEDREVTFGGDIGGYRVDGVRHAFPASPAVRVEIRGGTRLTFFPSGGASGGRLVLRDGSDAVAIDIEALNGRAILSQ